MAVLQSAGPGGEPRAIQITGGRVVIGAADDCHIVLDDAHVSAHHAEVTQEEAGYWVRDLGSRNGTFLGPDRIHRAVLRHGARITVGTTVLVFLDDKTVETTRPESETTHPEDALARLVGLAGTYEGLVIPLRGVETHLGRALENDVVIHDPVVARRHLTVRHRKTRWEVVDHLTRTTRPLAAGDQLTVGSAVFRFEGSSGRHTRLRVRVRPGYVVIAGVVIAGVAVLLSLTSWRVASERPTGTVAAPIPEHLEVQAYHAGLDAFREGRYDEAARQFERVLGFTPAHQDARMWLERSLGRTRLQARLAEAHVALNTGRLGQAREQVARILSKDPDFPEALALRRKVETADRAAEQITRAQAAGLWQEAHDAYRDGRGRQAIASLEEMLQHKPGSPEAIQMLEQVRAVATHAAEALRLKREGQWTEVWVEIQAILALEHDHGNRYVQDAERTRAELQPRVAQAIETALHRGDTLLASGEALEAAKAFVAVLKLNPEHRLAQARLVPLARQVEDEAQRLYREGYLLKETNAGLAVERWEVVLALTLPDNPYYEKARTQLQQAVR